MSPQPGAQQRHQRPARCGTSAGCCIPPPVPAPPEGAAGHGVPSHPTHGPSAGDSPRPAGHCHRDPLYLMHNSPPSSATPCLSPMLTLATHAVSWLETPISPWQSSRAFPRILRAAQPRVCRSCPPRTPTGFGGSTEESD